MSFFSEIKRDFRAVFEKDPAARSAFEVAFLYSGFQAIFIHRINRRLYKIGIPFVPRLISQLARWITGIEIHPAAKIGAGFFIDHGMGVVIGETTEIGEDCLLYQGVTLGGTGKEKGKRHPTLGKGVVVGAGAKVLGNIHIGDYVKIGANSVVLKPVSDHSIVVGVPGRVIKKKVARLEEHGLVEVLDHTGLPDPVDERFYELEHRITELQAKIDRLEGKKSRMKVYNTLARAKEEFVPMEEGRVGIYACGVTVYDNCHIGHARSAVVFDMIRRYFRYKGYNVKFVKNFTDIDDKIINRAREEGISWDEVARKYTARYNEDMSALGVEPADVEPKATEHIAEIIQTTKGLIDKGFAYVVDGDVYFEVGKFPEYGKLSGRKLDDMMAGARVEVDPRKKNPMDFALWKSSKEGEPSWKSPWGAGRPGWHIECTAMSIKHLGESFDIHGGGADLVFPHHENEVAQSEAFTGKPFVRYWIHNGFITVDKEKMSKSLGNFFTIADILKRYDPEVVRFFLLGTHYRSPIEFSDEQLRDARAQIERYYNTVNRAHEFVSSGEAKSGAHASDKQISDFKAHIENFGNRFEEAMDDDFNTAMAIGHMFELVREINRFLDLKPGGPKAETLLKSASDSLRDTGKTLNVFQRTPSQWNEAMMREEGVSISASEVEEFIRKRNEARARKDWKGADAIRDELLAKGIVLEDKKGETVWKVKA